VVETFSQRIKEDIAQFVADPSRDGLQDLIRFFGGEFDQYELKEAWPEIPLIAKTTLAIANSGGGVILFGIRDATLEPVGLVEMMPKQQVFDTFRSYVPSALLNEITLLDFDYDGSSYEPISGKLIQVLAIPDIPHAIPFVCEEEWRYEDRHLRRGAIYIRTGTNTREADYGQIQKILHRRIGTENPAGPARSLSRELSELHELYVARFRALHEPIEVGTGPDLDATPNDFDEMVAFLNDLITGKQERIRSHLGISFEEEAVSATSYPNSRTR
jgi:predicted HTH transcriptional regulator